MEFYHGTSKSKYQNILKEGILYGVEENVIHRRTYLTPDINEARCYGDVVLKVHYNPEEHIGKHNYVEGCWQFRVYEPIDLKDVELIEYYEPVPIQYITHPRIFDDKHCVECDTILDYNLYKPYGYNTINDTILYVAVCPECKTLDFITIQKN